MQDTHDVGYQYFRKPSGFTPQEQEMVFVTVSMENACGYCAAPHSFIADIMFNVSYRIYKRHKRRERVARCQTKFTFYLY